MLHHTQLWSVYQMACQHSMIKVLYFKPAQGESVDCFLILSHEPLHFFMHLDWVRMIGPFLYVEKSWFLEDSFSCRIIFQSRWECQFQFVQPRPVIREDFTLLMDRTRCKERVVETRGVKSECEFRKMGYTFYANLLVMTRHFKNNNVRAYEERLHVLQNIYEMLDGDGSFFATESALNREGLKFLYEEGGRLFARLGEQLGMKEYRQVTLLRGAIGQLFLELEYKLSDVRKN